MLSSFDLRPRKQSQPHYCTFDTMESPTFRRSTPPGVTATAFNNSSDETVPLSANVAPRKTYEQPVTADCTGGTTKRQLSVIREELEILKERRQALEEQRNKLLAATLPPRPGVERGKKEYASVPRSRDGGCTRSGSEHSFMQATTASHLHGAGSHPRSLAHTAQTSRTNSCDRSRGVGAGGQISSALVNHRLISSEAQRRKRLETNPYSEMKSRLREDCEQDSMCRMGTFLLEDNSRVFTFGRERRFRPLPGEKEEYYLGAQKQLKQELNRRGQRRSQSALARVALLDETPGPGAYTPLYAKQSRPSVLTSLYY